MTTKPKISSPRPGTTMFLIVLALLTSAALLTGCSSEIPVAPDASIDAVAADIALPMTAKSSGLTVLSFPSQDFPGPPRYASGQGVVVGSLGGVRTDGEWVAVAFVREPDCVPDDYNLLSGLPNIPRVFGCQLTIEGRAWFSDPSNPAVPPVKAWHNGLGAVPIYFAHLSEYETAVADDVLTIDELNGLSSLVIGYASFHRDVIQFPLNGRAGTATVVSRGELEGGGSFQVSGALVGTEWNIRIYFE